MRHGRPFAAQGSHSNKELVAATRMHEQTSRHVRLEQQGSSNASDNKHSVTGVTGVKDQRQTLTTE
jgi:hypothetical protein